MQIYTDKSFTNHIAKIVAFDTKSLKSAFEKIESWYKAEELSGLVHFIVFPRGVKLTPKENFDYEMAPMKFFDVSSTDLRVHHSQNNRLKEVEEYIKKNGLYN